MQPDPQRQWFVFYLEKEEGPMTEAELKRKWRDRELDETAFVYTEGFEDWIGIDQYKSLLADAPLSQVIEKAPTPEKKEKTNTQKLETFPESSPTSVTQTTHFQEDSKTQKSKVASTTQSSQVVDVPRENTEKVVFEPEPKRPLTQILPWFFAILLIAGGAYIYMTQESAVKKEIEAPSAEKNTKTTSKAVVRAMESWDWSKLDNFHLGKSVVDAVVKIEVMPVNSARPILVGTLAPNLNAQKMWVAVFPKDERNLMVIPKVWYLETQIQDGYFSVGPLSLDGYDLAGGTYFYAGLFGDQAFGFDKPLSFEVPGFPENVTNAAKEIADRNSQRVAFAEKEKVQALERWKRSKQVAASLKDSLAVVMRGPKTLNAWKAMSREWGEEVQKLVNEQKSLLQQSLFHATLQKDLGEWINFLSLSLDHFHFAASKGPMALLKLRKVTLKDWLATMDAKEKSLEDAFSGAQNGGVPALSPEMIRRELELRKSREQQ